MDIHQIAKTLGRRGGQVRAKKLSRQQRRGIASLGGQSRAESLRVTKLIAENFRYLEAMEELAPSRTVIRVSTCRKRLPEISP